MNRPMVMASVLVFLGCAAQPTRTITTVAMPAAQTRETTTTVAIVPAGPVQANGQEGNVVQMAAPPPVAAAAGDSWFRAAMMQSKLLVGADGQTYVGLWIDAPNTVATGPRAPMDLALVVDTSGSMSGDKIRNAQIAASSMIASLSDGDIVSLYAFSVGAQQVSPPTVVSGQTRPLLQSMTQQLVAGGGTNMWAGIEAGENTVMQAPPTHTVRRVVVISDGQANIGPSSNEELGNLAARGTEYGTQITAIGVGLDYNEHTLGALAVRSSGRMYHLEQPSQMSAILESETQLLGRTVASGAYIELDPAPGVVIDPTENVRLDRVSGRLRIPLGTVHAGQHREILLRARVATTQVGMHPIGRASMVYGDPSGGATHRNDVALSYEVTPDRDAVARGANGTVLAMVTSYEATQAQLRAAQMLDRGEAQQAVAELDQAQQRIQQAQQTYHFDDEQISGQLVRQSEGLHRGRTAAQRVMSAPAAARPAMTRGASLVNSSAAMDAAGF